jgi:phage replication-related protein YjqB (UPF0714/DUF867 family)
MRAKGGVVVADKYANFAALAGCEVVGVDYRIDIRLVGNTLVLAPHAGGIEPGTSELAEAIAAGVCSLYLFEGLKQTNNGDLHITSTHFDEPECLKALRHSDTVLAIHGEDSDAPVVYVGGLDSARKARIATTLRRAEFDVRDANQPHLAGNDAQNICNRGLSRAGVQLEISVGLRRKFFLGLTPRIERAQRTSDFDRFVSAVREGLLEDTDGGAR